MSTTNATQEEYTDEPSNCGHHWCPGPTGETLPCFEYFDLDRDYAQPSVDDFNVTNDADTTA